MIRHILKIMWNQRRSNGWIFAELAVVAAAGADARQGQGQPYG